jgi:3-dehydroquinate synthase
MIASTLTCVVDAGISPKTGINLTSKNSAGVTHAPQWVIWDATLLKTDPSLRTGLAEMIKVAAVRSARFFAYLERSARKLLDCRFQASQGDQAIDCAARLYLQMKAEPPFPGNEPASLRSFGHRFSRMLESRSQYMLTHGEAVSAEMAVTSRLAALCGVLDPTHADRIVSILADLDLLPYCPECNVDSVWASLSARPNAPGGMLLPVPGPLVGAGTFLVRCSKEQLAAAIASIAQLHSRWPIDGKVEYRTTRAGEPVLVTALFRTSGAEKYCESDDLYPNGNEVKDLSVEEKAFAYRLLRRGGQPDTLPQFHRPGEPERVTRRLW